MISNHHSSAPLHYLQMFPHTDIPPSICTHWPSLNRNISMSNVGAKGMAYLQQQKDQNAAAPAPRKVINRPPPEAWVDLHTEYGDILDQSELRSVFRIS